MDKVRMEIEKEYQACLRKESEALKKYYDKCPSELDLDEDEVGSQVSMKSYQAEDSWTEEKYRKILLKHKRMEAHYTILQHARDISVQRHPENPTLYNKELAEAREQLDKRQEKGKRLLEIAKMGANFQRSRGELLKQAIKEERSKWEQAAKEEYQKNQDEWTQITKVLRNQLNASLVNQDQQTITMQQIASESQRRGYDRFFAAVPIFDGTDPDMFDGWVEKLETACRISRRDIREEAICYSGGPVRQMIMTMPDDSTWADIKAEIMRNFSSKKTRIHAAALLTVFRKQKVNENLRNYIEEYSRILLQATGKVPAQEFDVERKLHFLRRLKNSRMTNKIIRLEQSKSMTPSHWSTV